MRLNLVLNISSFTSFSQNRMRYRTVALYVFLGVHGVGRERIVRTVYFNRGAVVACSTLFDDFFKTFGVDGGTGAGRLKNVGSTLAWPVTDFDRTPSLLPFKSFRHVWLVAHDTSPCGMKRWVPATVCLCICLKVCFSSWETIIEKLKILNSCVLILLF